MRCSWKIWVNIWAALCGKSEAEKAFTATEKAKKFFESVKKQQIFESAAFFVPSGKEECKKID